MKNKLTSPQQHFIIRRLACYHSPSEIVDAFASEFGIPVTSQQVLGFDPTLQPSTGKRKPQWIELFQLTRAAFINDVSCSQPIHRLMQLERIYWAAYRLGNDVVAMQALEQAAKEGGQSCQPQKPVGSLGGAVPVVASLEDWKRLRPCVPRSD